ncbi:MAG: CHAT domain-containing protein, partial [Acidobacteriota bacterium]|nr:CHAT domain-containing protein [Acidobacteriota bacterium]
MISRRFLVLVVTLCSSLSLIAQTQFDSDDQLLEEDYRVTTAEARNRAAADLVAKVDELRKAGQVVEAARALNRAGRFQIRSSAPDSAVATFKEALKLLERQTDVHTQIESLNGLASGYDYLSRCDLLEPTTEQAINLSKEIKFVAGEAEAVLTRSVCENYRDHALALASAQESLKLWRSIGRKRGTAEALTSIAEYQMEQDNLEESTKNVEAALNIYRELNDVERQAAGLIYLGFIEYRKGTWQNSLSYYAQAQALIDEKSEPYKMGQITAGIAESFIESGFYEIGLTKYSQALEYYRLTKTPRGVNAMRFGVGKALFLNGRYQEALDTLSQARADSEAINDPILVAFCDDYLGRTYYALTDSATALHDYEAAYQGYSKAKRPMEAARIQALIGKTYQQQGNLKRSRTEFQAALKVFRALTDHLNESATLYALGSLELKQNNLGLAEDYLRQSIDATENIRRISSHSDLTLAFSASVYERYEALIECLMRRHAAQPDLHADVDAFETHELARARSLTELLRASQTNIMAGLDRELAEQESSLRLALQVKENAKVSLLSTHYKQEDLVSLEAGITRLENQYKQVNETITARFPFYRQISKPKRISMTEIQQQVLTDDNTILLEYALGDSKSVVWIVTRSNFQSIELPGRDEIEDLARETYSSLTAQQRRPGETATQFQQRVNDADSKLPSQLSSLSKLLLGTIAGKLHNERLLIVADGALQYIPFQALTIPRDGNGGPDQPRPLVLDHEIVNEPSASALALGLSQSAQRTVANKSVAVLADPVFEANDSRIAQTTGVKTNASFSPAEVVTVLRDVDNESAIPRLPSSREEADAIMSIVPWRTGFKAVDFEASRTTAMGANLGQYRVVHFATHALLDDVHPDRSGIVLSMVDKNGKKQDGHLRLSDIYSLKLPVDLVVLSACQTGLGKDVKGEGLIGLTRGFMYAGASGVVASLWKVDDEATAELMKHFYEGMFEKRLSPSAALRAAQLK